MFLLEGVSLIDLAIAHDLYRTVANINGRAEIELVKVKVLLMSRQGGYLTT